jgi:putative PEP-CTERM system TPR-repeat lipoprotein
MDTNLLRKLACALLIGTAALSGCGKDAASFVASAKSYIAKSDYKAAVIELKNAIQKAPENAEARYLLASALLESGDSAGAEAEVRKAIALHAPDDETYPLLARAVVGQGGFDKAIQELATVKLTSAPGRADLAATLANAYLARGNLAAAKDSLAAAAADQPANARILLMQAEMAGRSGDLKAAREFVDTAQRNAPDDPAVLVMQSQIALGDGKPAEAQQLLEHAVAKNPASIAARFALLSSAVTSGKFDVAKAQLDEMKKVRPRDLRTVYGDAIVSYATADYARARDTAQSVLAVQPDHLPSLLLSGLANVQLGSLSTAEESLTRFIARVPENSLATRALATLYMRTGRAQQALEMLTAALRRSPDDPLVLRMTGEAYLASGNAAGAARSYERANQIDKGNLQSQLRLAQVRFAAGDTDRAFSDLESLSAESDAKQHQADLALFSEHLRRRQFDQAFAVVDRLEKKQPKSALPANLRGVAYLAKRDLKNARASFEKALALEPTLHSAAYNLAVIDMQEGKPQAARARYEEILAKDPKNEQAMLALAELASVSGGSAGDVRAQLEKAVTANPTSVRARLALISHYIREKDPKAAVATAQAGLAAIPNHPQLTEALGVSQMAAGDGQQAVQTFTGLSRQLPQNPAVLLRLADAYVSLKDYASAVESERKALAIKPDLDQAWAALVKTYVAWGRPDEAIAEARKLIKQDPNKALGYAIEGEVFATQRKWSEAATAFRNGMSHQPSPILAGRLYTALQSAGKGNEASAMAAKWMNEHPKDVFMLGFLAQQSQQRKDYPAAIAGYKKVLDINPDSIIALNNLAWLLAENKDRTALEYAERAHQQAPFNPNVLDTLGYVLTQNGDAKRAVPLLRMASTISPQRGEIRLHLAKALADSGDKAAARQTLTELTKLNKDSPVRAEAEKLLATL